MTDNRKFTLLLLSGKDAPVRRQYGRELSMKLPYVPPYGEFRLLKDLELGIRRKFRWEGPESLVLDLTEWIGHTDEEYFGILAKYLHDHSDLRLVFTAQAERAEAAPMFTVLRTYLPGRLEEDRTFGELPALTAYLDSTGRLSKNAAAYLAELILRPEGEPLRSYAVLDSLLCELSDGSGKPVNSRELALGLRDPDTLLGVLFDGCPDLEFMIPERKGGVIHELGKAV